MVDLTSFEPRPTREDNWLGWSKSAPQPRGDQSGEILGKTIGSALENAGKIGGDITRAYAKSGAEDILNEDTTRLEGIASNLGVDQGSILGARGQADDPNKAPQEVMNAGTTIENLQSSKANGAMSNTYMDARILQFQKDTRSKFPFFRAQFDEGVREATGVAHTANEYHQKLLADINSFLTAKDTSKNAIISEARSHMGTVYGGQSAADIINKVTDGSMTHADAWNWLNKSQMRKQQNDDAISEHNANKAIAEDVAERAVPNAQQVAYGAVKEYNMTFAKQMGLTDDSKILDAIASKQTPQEQRMWTEKYALHLQNLDNEVDNRMDCLIWQTDSMECSHTFQICDMLLKKRG